jgi:RimJ/RimL family protein N-acetyltransferase
MASSPVLFGVGFVLRPFAEDLITPRYVGWLNDRELMKYSRQRFYDHDIESCSRFAASFNDSPNYFWAILADDPQLGHIGNLTANVDSQNQLADLTLMVGAKEAQGMGFGAAAFALALDYLLKQGGMRKVTGGTMAINQGFLRVMQKSGMVEDGVRQRHFLYQGQEINCIMYAKYATEL